LVRGLGTTVIQADELWSYVYAKELANVKEGSLKAPPPDQLGEFYTWTALDPESKLFISWNTGDRTAETGHVMMADLASRVTQRVLITTDSWAAYLDVIQRSFGTDADHVVLKKKTAGGSFDRNTGNKVVPKIFGISKRAQGGAIVDLKVASTSLIERHNSTIRNFMSRYGRQTYRFSKKLENHNHAFSIFVMFYNFVRSHGAWIKRGSPYKNWTPAMKAGLTTKIWTNDDLLDEVDNYWRAQSLQPVFQVVPTQKYVPLPAGMSSSRTYFVMFSPKKHETKVHKGICRNCRHGVGRKDGVGTNQWFDFDTVDAAKRCARELAPLQFSECAICIKGKYAGARSNPRRRLHRRKLIKATWVGNDDLFSPSRY
jgi:IS1 family transposase